MSWLWSESEPKRARWSLNSTICTLRKILAGAQMPVVSPIRVVLEKGYYRLSPDVRVSSDRDEFDARSSNDYGLEKAGQIQEAVAEYEKAVELYRMTT
jgi:DNA-binding SARP family transcriptional activator